MGSCKISKPSRYFPNFNRILFILQKTPIFATFKAAQYSYMATVIEIIFFMKVVSQWSSSSDGGYLLRKIFLQALARFQLSGTTIYDCHLLSSSVLLILLPHPVIFISSRTQHARVHHSHITKHQFWARWQFFCLQIINITTLPHDRRLVKI